MTGTAKSRWGIVLLAVSAGVFVAFQVGKVPGALPVIRDDLGMTLVAGSWLISLLYAIATGTGMIAGAVADGFGARKVIVGSLLLVGAASLAGAFAPTGPYLLVARFFEGLGAVTVYACAPIIIMRAIRQEESRIAFGLWGTYMPMGTGIMLVITPFALELIGWRGLWILNAALLAAFALYFWHGSRSVPDPKRAEGPRLAALKRDIGAVARTPGPWLLAFCFATYTANYLIIAALLPTFLVEQRGMEIGFGALVAAAAALTNVIGNLTGGYLGQRGLPRWLLIMTASLTMGVTALWIYGAATDVTTIVILTLVFTGVGGLLPASIFGGAIALAPSPTQVGTTNGMIIQFSNIGQLTGPPIFALLVSRTNWEDATFMVLGLGIVGMTLAGFIGLAEAKKARALKAAAQAAEREAG